MDILKIEDVNRGTVQTYNFLMVDKNNFCRILQTQYFIIFLAPGNRNKCPTFAARIAGVAKLVDVPDLGSGAVRHGGSSPSTRTSSKIG